MPEDQNTSESQSVEPQVNQKNKFSLSALIIFVVIALIFAGAVGYLTATKGDSGENKDEKQQEVQSLAPNTVVYGYWSTDSSIINAYDLSTQKNKVLTKLPSNIKHVKVISPNQLAYIKNVNDRDYGTELVIYSLNDQKETTVFKAEGGYEVDDYKVSPDGKMFAIWQILPPTDNGPIKGGQSQVATVTLNSGQKNIIYDESTLTPVHYPIAITNSGDVFLDTFLANAEAGWAYGMSKSNFKGDMKEEIKSMAGGTYSTQPVRSPDGNKLIFAGYDGSEGDGKAFVGGFRRALAKPNSVEIYDLTTNVRSILMDPKADTIYPSANWDLASGDPVFSILTKSGENSGNYLYDFSSKQYSKIDPLKNSDDLGAVVYAHLPNNKILLGKEIVEETTLGNLGDKYAPTISSMFVYDQTSGETTNLNLDGALTQLIAVKDSNYFSKVTGLERNSAIKNQQLKLKTFSMKPKLSSMRTSQQSGERCRDVAAAQCNELHGTSISGDEARTKNATSNQGTGNEAFDACFIDLFKGPGRQSLGACSDSPLYLYGQVGKKVTVNPLVPIYSTNIPYNSGEEIKVILGKNGSFTANSSLIQSLSFDYTPAVKRIDRPKNGVVVKSAEIERKMEELSAQLGLNEAETRDTVEYAVKNANSKYVFVSFFDHSESNRILPLLIEPTPDNYRNIVFYLENLEKPLDYSLQLPIFEKVERGGFTAIEISFIVR